MKKILPLILVVAVLAFTACAPSAEKLMNNYEEITGFNKVDLNDQNLTVMMNMSMKGNGMNMPIKMIMQGANKFNIQMNAMGQDITMIRNGDSGWMNVGGAIQELGADVLDQQGAQTNVLKSMKFDKEKFNFEYVGEEDGFEKIKVTENGVEGQQAEKFIFFGEDGLIAKVSTSVNGTDVVVNMKDYKQFGDVKLPAVMETVAGGQTMTIAIEDFQIGAPVDESTFAQPVAQEVVAEEVTE